MAIKMSIEQQEKELREMREIQDDDKIITSKEAWDGLEELRNTPVVRFLSQFKSLDRMLDGFREGDIVVVSGITKHGKTSFCQTLTSNFSSQNIPCLWFSYEMSLLEFLQKFKPELPLFTLPSKLKESSLAWIERKIIESKQKHDTKIVFIDHLHFLLSMGEISSSRQNISLMIGSLMRELKKMALRNKVCIFLIAHTTKVSFEEEPGLDSIRDSSFIAQEADTVLMVRRLVTKKIMSNESVLSVIANRRTGENGKVRMMFHNGKYSELEQIL